MSIKIKNNNGELVDLDLIDDIDTLKNTIKKYQDVLDKVKTNSQPTISVQIASKSSLDKVSKMIEVICKNMTISGKLGEEKLSKGHVTALSIYVLHGINQKSKQMVMEITGSDSMVSVNAFNNQLRRKKLLLNDSTGYRKTYLCPELEALSNFVSKNNKTDKIAIKTVFSVT